MNMRYWLTVGITLVALVGLAITGGGAPLLAGAPASEHYSLASSEVGSVPIEAGTASYALNEGVALQAEVAAPMLSESYRVGGITLYKVYLPLVLKEWR